MDTRRINPLLMGSVKFEHVIAEGVMGMVVTHPMVGINVERMENNVEVNVEPEEKTAHRTEEMLVCMLYNNLL